MKFGRSSVYSCTGTGCTYALALSSLVTSVNLRRRGRQLKRKRRYIRPALHGRGRSIEDRPQAANERSEYGHWEMGSITSGLNQGSACVLNMVERMTREPLMLRLRSHTQAEVNRVLDKLERKMEHKAFSNKFKSITVDNGHDFLNHEAMESSIKPRRGKRTSIYYTHPYCSSERGSVEQLNRMIRWFIPKGARISEISHRSISDIERWLRELPRRVLGGHSAGSAVARAMALPALP